MPIIQDNFVKMSQSHSVLKPVKDLSNITLRINAELLTGCEFSCPGCFVNKNQKLASYDANELYSVIKEIENSKYNIDEIILGPTDFFSAKNSNVILSDSNFLNIFKNKEITLILLSTLQSEKNEILRRIELVNNFLTIENEIELLIPFDLEKITSQDKSYIGDMREKLKLLNHFDSQIDYAFQINIRDLSRIQNFDLYRLTKIVREEFDTIIEFNPSFLRSTKSVFIKEALEKWKHLLIDNFKRVEENRKNEILLTAKNKNHAGITEVTFNYKNGTFYACPFIYENIFNEAGNFKVLKDNPSGSYQFNDLINYLDHSTNRQLLYTSKTTQCSECPQLTSCIGKQVLDFMQEYEIVDCIFPKEVF